MSIYLFLLKNLHECINLENSENRGGRVMVLQGRAYYNSLRMDWVDDPTMDIEAWKVEDYRSLAVDSLFEKLEDLGFDIDKESFNELALEAETPEDLAKTIANGASLETEEKVFLVVFELWRRLLPEKLSLSVFCDEIDTIIFQFDRNDEIKEESIEDMVAHLQMFLDENCDDGINPEDAFSAVQSHCANDVEGFLYDYISDQIHRGNSTYASDLMEGFRRYLPNSKWFDLLEIRLQAETDEEVSLAAIKKLIKQTKDLNLSYALEILSFLVSHGDEESFKTLVKKTLPLLEIEEDFMLLLSESADFYHRLDQEKIEAAITNIAARRKGRPIHQPLAGNDPDFSILMKLFP